MSAIFFFQTETGASSDLCSCSVVLWQCLGKSGYIAPEITRVGFSFFAGLSVRQCWLEVTLTDLWCLEIRSSWVWIGIYNTGNHSSKIHLEAFFTFLGSMTQDPYVLIANLRKELGYMRTNLDSSRSLCAKLEGDKMDLAYELKVFGNKEGPPTLPPLICLVSCLMPLFLPLPLLFPFPPFPLFSFFFCLLCSLVRRPRKKIIIKPAFYGHAMLTSSSLGHAFRSLSWNTSSRE